MTPLSERDRAILQQRLAAVIRSASPAERIYRASRAKAMALAGGPQTIVDETQLAVMAAVCFDDALWDACTQVRQTVILDDALASDVVAPDDRPRGAR